MAEEEKFDREVRAKLKDQEKPVPAHLWEQISHALPPETPARTFPWKCWTGGALGVVLVSAVLYFALNSSDNKIEQQNENVKSLTENSVNSGARVPVEGSKDTDSDSVILNSESLNSSFQSGTSSTPDDKTSRNTGNSSIDKNATSGGRNNNTTASSVSSGKGGNSGVDHTQINTSGANRNNKNTDKGVSDAYSTSSSPQGRATSSNPSGVKDSSHNNDQRNITSGNIAGSSTSNPSATAGTSAAKADKDTDKAVTDTHSASSTPQGNTNQGDNSAGVNGSSDNSAQTNTGKMAAGNSDDTSATDVAGDAGSAYTQSNTSSGDINDQGTDGRGAASSQPVSGTPVDTSFAPGKLVNGSAGEGNTVLPTSVAGVSDNTNSGQGGMNVPSEKALGTDSNSYYKTKMDFSTASADSTLADTTAKPQEEQSEKGKKEEKNKKDRQPMFSVEGYLGAGYGAYNLKLNPDAPDIDSMGTIYMQSRFDSVSTSKNIAFSGGLRLNYQFSARFEMHVGIRYQQYQQLYAYNVQRFDSIYFASTDTDLVNPLRHYTPIPYSGKEKTTFIAIPIGLTYKHELNDLVSLYGRGAVELMMVKSSGWVAYDTAGAVYLSGKPSASFNVGVYLSAGVQYKLSNSLLLFAEPNTSFVLRNMYGKSDLVKQKPLSVGLSVGVRYEF